MNGETIAQHTTGSVPRSSSGPFVLSPRRLQEDVRKALKNMLGSPSKWVADGRAWHIHNIQHSIHATEYCRTARAVQVVTKNAPKMLAILKIRAYSVHGDRYRIS